MDPLEQELIRHVRRDLDNILRDVDNIRETLAALLADDPDDSEPETFEQFATWIEGRCEDAAKAGIKNIASEVSESIDDRFLRRFGFRNRNHLRSSINRARRRDPFQLPRPSS